MTSGSDLTPPPGSTRALMQSVAPSLVPSERRVVQVCLEDPDAVSRMSVTELAHRADASPATVVRACKNLGVGGFQRLRELLLRDAVIDTSVTASPTSSHPFEQVFSHASASIDGAIGAMGP